MTDITSLSALELSAKIESKALTSVQVVSAYLDRIEQFNPKINAIISLRPRVDILADALLSDETPRRGWLSGLPIAIKDLADTKGIRTTSGSPILAEHVPAQDCLMVQRIKQAGAIVIGKTNTPEFGAGANTRNLVFGATGNPFAPEKTCGGSSGGSAVALATGMMPLASGSDYGGSLRTPAGFCGVVGIRPSPGIVAAEGRPVGLLPFSVLGPMGRTVDDAYLLLQAQMGVDAHDPFSTAPDVDLFAPLEGADLGSIRAMITADLGAAPMSKSYRSIFAERVGVFKGHFAATLDSNPDFSDGDNSFEVLRGVNFVAAHGERVRQHRDKLSPNVVDNVDRGLTFNLEDVAIAHLQQSKIARNWLDLFEEVDVVICPAASTSPFSHSQWSVTEIDDAKMATYMRWLAITYLPTMALASAVVLPCGLDDQKMPFGIQILSAPGRDRLVVEVAKALEDVLASHPTTMRPIPDLAKLTS